MNRLLFCLPLALLMVAPAKAQMAAGAANGATGQVTAGTGPPATLIAAQRTGGPGQGRVSITITNKTGSDSLCVGFSSSVTPSTGECLPPIAGASITLNTTQAIYGVVPSSPQVVSFAETF
jgi:hypothetical protein